VGQKKWVKVSLSFPKTRFRKYYMCFRRFVPKNIISKCILFYAFWIFYFRNLVPIFFSHSRKACFEKCSKYV